MILAVCLNPAFQRTLHFQGLSFNRVNRAKSVAVSAGGKGVNVARIAVRLDADVRLLTLLGGSNGRKVKRILEEEGISIQAVSIRGDTRICSTLLDLASGTYTELAEESEPVSEDEVRRAGQAFEKLLPRARMAVFSGTAPKGFPETVYQKWIAKAKALGIPSILDAPGKLAECGMKARPWLFKLNWIEMETLVKGTIRSEEEAKRAMEILRAKGAENVLVTRDGPGAMALVDGQFYRMASPNLKVVNPIGSGDAFAGRNCGGILHGQGCL